MDKNTITAFLLIGIILFAFVWFNEQNSEQKAPPQQPTGKEQEQPKPTERAVPAQASASDLGAFCKAGSGEEEFFTLENEVLEIVLSNKGGQIVSARLKDYQTHDAQPLFLFKEKESSFDFTLITPNNRVVNTKQLYFEPILGDDRTITFRLYAGEESYLDYAYALVADMPYMVEFRVTGNRLEEVLSSNTMGLNMEWKQMIRQQEKGRSFEERYSGIYYRFTSGEVKHTNASKEETINNVSGRLRWIGYKDQFFSSLLISDKSPFENGTGLDQKISQQNRILKECSTKAMLPFDVKNPSLEMRYCFIPNKYSLLKSYDNLTEGDNRLDLTDLISMRVTFLRPINTWFVLPIFNFFGKFINNYGIIILLLTLVIKLLLFPLTYKSYISSAKMRVLRPQVEAINAKYPEKEKAMEKQKETMALYNRAGASPMSGCLPMLLQMPFWIALFDFFPSAIELRQVSFLWAKDLSTYDAVFSWDAYIPLVTPFFGNHISLFCLLMAITNIFYTKYNMAQTNTGQQQMPGMKMMMYLMPVMMLVWFNQYPAGLSYYFFISTLITIILTFVCRGLVNEEKLLAQMEANKKKPAKKTGFMARLEEAQRRQMAEMKKQQQQQKKRR